MKPLRVSCTSGPLFGEIGRIAAAVGYFAWKLMIDNGLEEALRIGGDYWRWINTLKQ